MGKLRASRLAVVGDLHGRFSDFDVAHFDHEGFDLVVFLGDLGSGTRNDGIRVAKKLARLRTPALVIPGNNDADHLPALAAELALQAGRAELMRRGELGAWGGVQLCGFSRHELETGGGPVTLVIGRPCSLGGPRVGYPEQLQRLHGVATMAESAARLERLVDEAESSTLLFLAHNGPSGLGGDPVAQWGRDFDIRHSIIPGGAAPHEPLPRDWGDEDLRAAVQYARGRGKRVLAVVAGHMHRHTRAGERPLCVEVDGVWYINAACVPRIVASGEGSVHHHVELAFHPSGLTLIERWVPAPC